MHVVVCVKHVPDTTELRVDPDTGSPMLKYAPTRINDYDRHALEEAACLREQRGYRVTVLCAGPPEEAAARTMKEALAAGADEALLINGTWAAGLDPPATARVLAAGVRHVGGCDLVLCGDLSEDGYHGLVPGMLAARLGLPFVSGGMRLELADGSATVTRVTGDVEETYRLRLPAVVSVSRLINTPRLVTTLQVVRVAASRVKMASAQDVGVDEAGLAADRLGSRIVSVRPATTPRRRELLSGELDTSVERLVAWLADIGCVQ
jgi:electron transfer flavoprotein beta subunit